MRNVAHCVLMTHATGGPVSVFPDATADVKRVIPARANAFNASRSAMEIYASIIVALVV